MITLHPTAISRAKLQMRQLILVPTCFSWSFSDNIYTIQIWIKPQKIDVITTCLVQPRACVWEILVGNDLSPLASYEIVQVTFTAMVFLFLT